MKDFRDFFAKAWKPGTPLAALFYGVVGLVVAVLFLLIGFWKTVLVALCVGMGLFLGGVADKHTIFRRLLSRIFPSDN
ncbi:MAG: DUF2273 domain-containing protein [Oscillospiraceae bacterium]|jgi:uncharacterized membrane protein|nr:DUF2273 domain-containing protein [Oscillospiraceae bacterium]